MIQIRWTFQERICGTLIALLLISSVSRGQVPTISVSQNEVEIGSNFTVICHVLINSDIIFYVNDTEKGSCPHPAFGGPCVPPDIQQNTTAQETSWTLMATIEYEGDWHCNRLGVDSSTIAVSMYKCPNSIITESGIHSSLSLNDTATVSITIKIGCIYPTNNPEILLRFMSSISSAVPYIAMNCFATLGACSTGSAYECNQIISRGMGITNGPFDSGTNYTLHVDSIVVPSVSTCGRLAVFEPHSLVFETKGQTLSTHSTSISDVTQSKLRVQTEGGIHSLNTLSNWPDETMKFSSILPTSAETSSSSQTVVSSDLSQHHISNTYTTAYLISTTTLISSKAISSDTSVLFNSFSNVLGTDASSILSSTLRSRDVSQTTLGMLSYVRSASFQSSADIYTTNMLSTSINTDTYELRTYIPSSRPEEYSSTIFSSIPKYFYSSGIDFIPSSVLVSSSVNEAPVLTYDPSLSKTSKVFAISGTVVGCIILVTVTVLVLFALKLLQCKPQSKTLKTNKTVSNIDSNHLSVSNGEHRLFSFFDKPYGLPTRYYDIPATSLGQNEVQFTCNYNKNWDEIT